MPLTETYRLIPVWFRITNLPRDALGLPVFVWAEGAWSIFSIASIRSLSARVCVSIAPNRPPETRPAVNQTDVAFDLFKSLLDRRSPGLGTNQWCLGRRRLGSP